MCPTRVGCRHRDKQPWSADGSGRADLPNGHDDAGFGALAPVPRSTEGGFSTLQNRAGRRSPTSPRTHTCLFSQAHRPLSAHPDARTGPGWHSAHGSRCKSSLPITLAAHTLMGFPNQLREPGTKSVPGQTFSSGRSGHISGTAREASIHQLAPLAGNRSLQSAAGPWGPWRDALGPGKSAGDKRRKTSPAHLHTGGWQARCPPSRRAAPGSASDVGLSHRAGGCKRSCAYPGRCWPSHGLLGLKGKRGREGGASLTATTIPPPSVPLPRGAGGTVPQVPKGVPIHMPHG